MEFSKAKPRSRAETPKSRAYERPHQHQRFGVRRHANFCTHSKPVRCSALMIAI